MIIEGIVPSKVRHERSLVSYWLFEKLVGMYGEKARNWKEYAPSWFFVNNMMALYVRQFYGDKLWALTNRPFEIMEEFNLGPEDYVLAMAKLDWTLRGLGLCSDLEVDGMYPADGRLGARVNYWPNAKKYLTFEQAMTLARDGRAKGEVWGLIHGDFDPSHYGHWELVGLMSMYCDGLLVGFDPTKVNRQRKQILSGDVRPRFPLIYRMWHMAALGRVSGVFVMPVENIIDGEYLDIYRSLGITVLGVGTGHSLQAEYLRRMDVIGGDLVVNQLPAFSSTRFMERFTDLGFASMEFIRWLAADEIRMTCEMAKRAGFLRDKPDEINF